MKGKWLVGTLLASTVAVTAAGILGRIGAETTPAIARARSPLEEITKEIHSHRVEAPEQVQPYRVPLQTENIDAQYPVQEPVKQSIQQDTQERYASFKFKSEIPLIERHAVRYGLEPELLMAIRMAERGKPGKEYGVLTTGKLRDRYDRDRGYTLEGKFIEYSTPIEKQVAWCAASVRNIKERFESQNKITDFLDYLASEYAPKDAENDPNNLNHNWEKNVRKFYDRLKN